MGSERGPVSDSQGGGAARRFGGVKQTQEVALTVDTYNTTSWAGLKAHLATTESLCVAAQETHVLAGRVPEASQWAKRHGWHSLWAPAIPGKAEPYSSGGVALFVRATLGLRSEGKPDLVEGRLVRGLVEVPGYPVLAVYSGYFHTGLELQQPNLELLAEVGRDSESLGCPFVLAADFNMEPEVLANAGFLEKSRAEMVFTNQAQGTCRGSSGGTRLIDFFVVDRDLSRAISRVSYDEESVLHPHRPVKLEFYPRVSRLKTLGFRLPDPLPLQEPFGPRPKPQDWTLVQASARVAVEAARRLPNRDARLALDNAYMAWARVAEQEIAHCTGASVKRPGLRGVPAKLVLKPVVHTKASGKGKSPELRAAQWLFDRSSEVQHLWGSRPEASLPRLQQLRVILEGNLPGFVIEACHSCLSQLRQVVCEVILCKSGADHEPCRLEEAAESLSSLHEDIRSALGSQQQKEEAASSKLWKEWVEQALRGSASAAHRFTREPEAWCPTTTLLEDGNITADPLGLLQAQGVLWKGIWQASEEEDQEREPLLPSGEPLEPLTPEQLLQAAQAFPTKTSAGVDGFHLRNFVFLSRGGFEALSALYTASEIHGYFPSPARKVVVALLEKPAGGFRPIGIFCSLYRLWAKCRRPLCDRWEHEHDRAYYAASRGRSTVDCVWRQAVLAQTAVAKGEHSASVLWDISKFYENVSHEKLVDRAIRSGFPIALLRVAIQMYRAPRHLTFKGLTLGGLCPLHGVVAGCAAATTFVKIYTIEPLDSFLLRNPFAQLDVYIDDFHLGAQGTPHGIQSVLVEASEDLALVIQEEFECSISLEKAAVVASSDTTLRLVRRGLGEKAGVKTSTAKNLGVDFAAGRMTCRQRRMSLTRRKRIAKVVRRKQRLRRLVKVAKVRAQKIFTTGMRPAGTYGAAVTGIDNMELLRLRRAAVVSLPPYTGGSSRTAKLAIYGDPLAPETVAAMLRWAKEVWCALCGSDDRAFSLGQLAAFWGRAHPKRAHKWHRSRGPLDAMFLEADRLGWSWRGPFTLVDDQGHELALTKIPPKLLRSFACEAIARGLQRSFADGCAEEGFTGKRMATEHIRAYLKSRRHSPMQKACVSMVFCKGYWTRDKLLQGGYLLEAVCALCGEPDSLHHRLWCCQHADAIRIRAELVEPALVSRALREGPGNSLFNRAWLEHPQEYWAPLADDGGLVFEQLHDGAFSQVKDPSQWKLSGSIYSDGSAFPSPFMGLARAGWALAQVDSEGYPTRRVWGPVWAPLPQTAIAAEWCAEAVAAQFATGTGCSLTLDCQSVLSVLKGPRSSGLSHKNKWAGLFRDSCTGAGWSSFSGFFKVKAHQTLACAEGDATLQASIRANECADFFAKEGANMHPTPQDSALTKLGEELGIAEMVIKLVAGLLPLWPKETRGAPRGATVPSARGPRRRHSWFSAGGKVQCRGCLSFAGSPERAKARFKETCPGKCVDLENLLGNPMGHNLVVADIDEATLLICSRCGSWFTRKAVGLARPCNGVPSIAGACALKRVGKGFHPVHPIPIAGLWSLRECKQVGRTAVPTSQHEGRPSVAERNANLLARVRARMAACSGVSNEG